MRYSLEFLGRVSNMARPKFKTKIVNVIFFDNLKNKNKIKQGSLVLPYHAGNYDYTKDIQEFFITNCKLRVYVSRETLRKSKTFIYHIYFFKS